MPCCKKTEYRNRILDSLCNWTKAPVLFGTFYFIILLGFILWCRSIYFLVRLSHIYPTKSLLFGAAVSTHFAVTSVAVCLPMSHFLIWLQHKKPAIPLLYMVGCIITIALCFTTLLLLEPYRDRDFVRNEYLNKTKDAVKNTEKGLPTWVGLAQSRNCCSWFGPYDFGRIYETPNTGAFIDALKKECFFNDKIEADPVTKLTPVPGGCSKAIKKAVKESCEELFIISVIIIFTTLGCILVYLYYYWQMLLTSVDVADTENRRMVAIVAQSVTHIQSLMSLQSQSPSVLRLTALQRESERVLSSKNRIKAPTEKLIYSPYPPEEQPVIPNSDVSVIK